MKRIWVFFLAVIILLFDACSASTPSAVSPTEHADQQQFLKDMAKGIENRLAKVDDEKHENDTDEQKAEYWKELVKCELDKIEKYEAMVFSDKTFDRLAHHYISACKMQQTAAMQYKNKTLSLELWNSGRAARAAIITEFYSRYDLPITGEAAASYNDGSSSTTAASNSTSSRTKENTPYVLGTILKRSCERGEAVISLDKIEIKGSIITLTVTNHGSLGFTTHNSCWNLTYYDSDGYALSTYGYINAPEPWKPGETMRISEDISYWQKSYDIKYISVNYFVFHGSKQDVLDTSITFNYAFDLSGNQIDYDKLIH